MIIRARIAKQPFRRAVLVVLASTPQAPLYTGPRLSGQCSMTNHQLRAGEICSEDCALPAWRGATGTTGMAALFATGRRSINRHYGSTFADLDQWFSLLSDFNAASLLDARGLLAIRVRACNTHPQPLLAPTVGGGGLVANAAWDGEGTTLGNNSVVPTEHVHGSCGMAAVSTQCRAALRRYGSVASNTPFGARG